MVAVGVIQRLEVVEVGHNDAERGVVALRQKRFVVQALLEGAAAEAAGEGVRLAAAISWRMRRSRCAAAAAVITPAMTIPTARNAVVDQLRSGVRIPTTKVVRTPNPARNDTVPRNTPARRRASAESGNTRWGTHAPVEDGADGDEDERERGP